jgi:thiamine biosynthesis lipoprotein ApbE
MKVTLKSTISILLLILLCSAKSTSPTKTKVYIFDYENVLGTSYELKVVATSEERAAIAEGLAMEEIDRLNKILSGYDKTSEFSRWMNGEKKETKISAELFEVLSLFDEWRKKTNGALDASAEVVGKVWKNAAKSGKEPSNEEIATAIAKVKQHHWVLNSANQTAIRLDDVPLMLNSFAKSYIINKAVDKVMASQGINGVVMNIGGDMVIRGNHEELVAVSNPKADAENDAPIARLNIKGKAVATSGNYRRGELINGKWYSHIVDPRTGMPADDIISATVISNNATDAGALATAFNVLSPDESKALAAGYADVAYMIMTSKGEILKSDNWATYEIPEIKKPTIAHVGDKTWDPSYELTINLELNQIEGMRVHRPYVAIWVVDKKKKPVRNITLWYNKTKYLDDMPAWYEAYYAEFNNTSSNVSSTTSATRPAGKYTIKWDGKDDKGELVKNGTYTIMIEVAREHGTHQLMQQEFDFTKKVQPVTLAGNVEVASVSLNYGKKSDGQ